MSLPFFAFGFRRRRRHEPVGIGRKENSGNSERLDDAVILFVLRVFGRGNGRGQAVSFSGVRTRIRLGGRIFARTGFGFLGIPFSGLRVLKYGFGFVLRHRFARIVNPFRPFALERQDLDRTHSFRFAGRIGDGRRAWPFSRVRRLGFRRRRRNLRERDFAIRSFLRKRR